MSLFDYPITRPYPWRYTTPTIFLACFIVLCGTVYLNVATVGLMEYTVQSSEYVDRGGLSWLDRLRLKNMSNTIVGCDPGTLLSRATYNTANGIFSYQIQSLTDISTNATLPGTEYHGEQFTNCSVDLFTVSISMANSEMNVQANVNCSLPSNISVISTTTTEVTLRDMFPRATEIEITAADDLPSDAVPKMLKVYASYTSWLFEEIPEIAPQNMSYMAFQITPGTKSTIKYDLSVFKRPSYLSISQQYDNLEAISADASMILKSYIRAFWSAILLDFGISSDSNIFTDPELRKAMIQWPHYVYPSRADSFPTLSNPHGLSRFNTLYQCTSVRWKSPTTLMIDLTVATLSIFMAFWTVLQLVLTYIAGRSSLYGNFCTCRSCEPIQNEISEPVGPDDCSMSTEGTKLA